MFLLMCSWRLRSAIKGKIKRVGTL
jgi:hypothetical protein